MVSVGATINIMLAAVHAEGQTVIENAAKEPEVVDVANFLISIGAQIKGAGTTAIKITGVDTLHSTEYQVIPDRIEAGSYMCMAAAAGEEVVINNIVPRHVEALTAKLKELGVDIELNDEKLLLERANRIIVLILKHWYIQDLQQTYNNRLHHYYLWQMVHHLLQIQFILKDSSM